MNNNDEILSIVDENLFKSPRIVEHSTGMKIQSRLLI